MTKLTSEQIALLAMLAVAFMRQQGAPISLTLETLVQEFAEMSGLIHTASSEYNLQDTAQLALIEYLRDNARIH